MTIDGDGYYMPFVPRQDLDLAEDETPPTAEEFEVRHPPVGLTRAERKDWLRDEASRIARLQNRTRRSPLARTPPRGLRGAGRREWRQADCANRKEWLEDERAKTGGVRSPGLGGAVVLAVAVLVVIFVIGKPSGQSPPPPPAPRHAVSTVAPSIPPIRGAG